MNFNIPELQALSVANKNAGIGLTIDEKKAAIKATLVKGLRVTPAGKIEVTVSHDLIPGYKKTRNFDCPYDAAAFKLTCADQLSRGIVPPTFRGESEGNSPAEDTRRLAELTLATVLNSRLKARGLKGHDEDQIATLITELGGTPLQAVNEKWALHWIGNMKAKRLKPGTIRKKVECLARAIETHYRDTIADKKDRPICVLRDLPDDYSTYDDEELGTGEDIDDEERHIRLPKGKDEEIDALIRGDYWPIPAKRGQGVAVGPYRMKDRQDLLMFYRVLLWCGLRLAEAYRLQVGDLDLAKCKININKARTKKGYARPVPIRGWLARELAEYITSRLGPNPAGDALVFPFLTLPSGAYTRRQLRKSMAQCSSRISQRLRGIFDAVGLDIVQTPNGPTAYRAHDLRHEGISRFMEWTNPDGAYKFVRAEEVMVYSGHRTMKQFRVYWNMREHDFSDPEVASFA